MMMYVHVIGICCTNRSKPADVNPKPSLQMRLSGEAPRCSLQASDRSGFSHGENGMHPMHPKMLIGTAI